VTGLLHALVALPPGKETLLPAGQEVGLTPFQYTMKILKGDRRINKIIIVSGYIRTLWSTNLISLGINNYTAQKVSVFR
jgi:hypothetical protein